MTEEQYIDLKDTYLRNIQKYMQQEGGMFSHISIFAEPLQVNEEEIDPERTAIIHIPIPEKMANSEQGKEYFISKMVPDIADTIKKQFNTVAVVWASEAWVRSAGKDEESKLEIVKEVGDVLWYCNALCRDLGYSLEFCMQLNISKLESRKQRNVINGNGDNR